MKLERRDCIDWESVDMTLHFDHDASAEELAKLKQLLTTWPEKAPPGEERESHPVPLWMDAKDKRTCRFFWEKWFPEEWFEPLARTLAAEFPSLTLLEIGQDFEPPVRDDRAFIAVPRKVVEFEDGSTMEVQPFVIAKYVVSIGQFEQFTQKTGYKTIAEQLDGYETFRDSNQFIGNVPEHKRHSLPAYCLSYLDALEYCKWAGVRLPTEAEWLAAAVIDDRICADLDEFDRIYPELREKPEALVICRGEMTGTVVNGRQVVVRAGPHLVRSRNEWLPGRNRGLIPIKDCEDPVVFRVCR